MLILTASGTDKLQIITSSGATIDVHASWTDLASAAVTPGRTNTAISSAATTDVVATPGTNTTRNVKTLHIRNKDTALQCDVTVVYNQNGTSYQLHKVTLIPGATLEYIEGVGFFTIVGSTSALVNRSVSAQSNQTTDTYLTGSNISIPAGSPIVGTTYTLFLDISKTAGAAAPTLNIRYGTAGSISDTARCTFTWAQTGVTDAGIITVTCTFRTVGSGTSAVLQGDMLLVHNLAATGLATTGTSGSLTLLSTSSGFDSTPANSIIGASFNGNTSFAGSIQLVRAVLSN